MRTLTLILFLIAGSAHAGGPNILFILADDLGWSDLSCYGNEIFETPNIDKLADTGTRFTQAYAAAPICSASRAGVLTGKTPARLGFEFVTKDKSGYQPVMAPLRAPPFTLNLDLEETTIPESLAQSGRPTAFFGKWHLNQHYQRYLGWSPTHGPKSQGFEFAEEDFGSHPYAYWNNRAERGWLDLAQGEFPIDALTKRAADFLKKPHKRPFFCMVSHFYVHDPVHTRIQWLQEHYLNKIPESHPRRETLASYGAMITSLDHYVGQLLDALDEVGLTESTLVVFTSDNGGHPNYAGNAPLRGSKWNLYEGGIRVPFITRFGKGLNKGRTCETPVTSLDLFPTFAAYAESDADSAMDGTSLIPLIHEQSGTIPARPLFWHFPYYHPEKSFDESPRAIGSDDGFTSQTRPHSAVREGDWKLIHFYEDDRVELYNLATDPGEQSDRSQANPKVAQKLQKLLLRYLKDSNARLPIPNPTFAPPQ